MEELVHHYTSIDTLELILVNRKIRFNRLDRVDDILESKLTGTYELAKYAFVSCWTYENNESIPQWSMYANSMKGVRITLPKDMFNFQLVNSKGKYYVYTVGDVYSPIKIEEMFGDDYIILPLFTLKSNLERKVIYVDNPLEKAKEFIRFNVDENGYVHDFNINSLLEVAVYKSKEWEFQKELRFAIVLFPSIPVPPNGINDEKYCKEMSQFIMYSILNNIPPNQTYFDIELSDKVLNNICVTLGPLTTDKDLERVRHLIDRYANHGKIFNSKFAGMIRAK